MSRSGAITLVLAALVLAAFNASALRVAVLSDTHVTPGNPNEAALRLAVDEINSGDASIVIMQGDLTNQGTDQELTCVKAILDQINKPLLAIPGNHENNWSQSAGKTFIDLWGDDRFATMADSIIIVGLNCGPYMKMGDGHVKQEDLAWLDSTLTVMTAGGGKRVLSVCHYPVAPDLDNYTDYIKVLEKYPVVVQIGGHYHTFNQYRAGGIDALLLRALDMSDGDYGYSILEIDTDSVRLLDKRLGQDPRPMFAFPVNTRIEALQLPQDEPQAAPDGYDITLVHSDEASIFTRVGIDANRIYFGNSLGYVKAVSKSTGKTLWSHKTSAALHSRPAPCGNQVAAPTTDCRLLWLDSATGQETLSLDATGPYVADGVVDDGTLYQGGYKTFQAWDVNTKHLLWSYDSIGNYCQAAPAIDSRDIVFGAWDTYLRCLNPATGALIWRWSNGDSSSMLSPGNCVPVITSDKVIIVAPDRYMTAIDKATGAEIWRNNDFKYRESLGASADGSRVYAKTMDGEIVAVSALGSHFSLLWATDAGFGYEHAPCVIAEVNGTVFAASRKGTIAALDAQSGELLWTYSLGSSQVNGLDIDTNGDIYASLVEGKIWRISRKTQ